MKDKLSIYNILRKRYSDNAYALMEEVRDKAGYDASRSADFIAVNLWPSRGLAINGIELKSSRSDWLNELKKPAKAENIFQYCDFFWLLTANDNVAKIEEIPETWGWLTIKGEKIFVQKEAQKLQPIALTKHFVCAMLKRAVDKTNFVHRDNIQKEIESVRENAKTSNQYELDRLKKKLDELEKIVYDFQKASGIQLQHNYFKNAGQIGAAVKLISDGQLESIREQLFGLEKTAQIVLQRIASALQATDVKAKKDEEQPKE